MPKIKYYDKIKSLESINLESQLPAFDIDKLQVKSFIGKLFSKLLRNPLVLLKILRRVWPIVRIGRIVLLTRADDVQEVLTNTKVFAVPFGKEMRIVSGGNDFILGLNDGAVYRAQKSLILTAFEPEKMADKISEMTAIRAQQCMRGATSGFDPIDDLFSKCGVLICEDYFGLMIGNKQRFYESSLAVSALLFADVSGNKQLRELAMAGAKNILKVIDFSIRKVREDGDIHESPLEKLVSAHVADPVKVPLNDVRSIMMGMILGFLPTTILGTGKALDVIFKKKIAKQELLKAIQSQDDQQIERVVVEAMRFHPIQVGPFRVSEQDYIIAAGTSRRKNIPKNSLVIPSTLSAMFDPRRVVEPDEFKPDRDKQDSMIFGYGLHSCIGAPMARAFSTQVLKSLFSLPNMHPASGSAGKIKWLGVFPRSVTVEWDQADLYGDQNQSMCTICIPLIDNDGVAEIQTALESLGNVAKVSSNKDDDQNAINILTENEEIHFASGCISEAVVNAEGIEEPAYLLFEINGDADENTLIKQFGQALEVSIGKIIKTTCGFDQGKTLSDIFLSHHLKGVRPLGKNSGLNFKGTPGHSVKRIKKEAELANKIFELIEDNDYQNSNNAIDRLNKIREHIANDNEFLWAFASVPNRLNEPPKGLIRYFLDYIKRPWSLIPMIILAFFIFLNFQILGGIQDNLWYNIWHVGAAVSMTVIGGVLIIGCAFLAVILYLRYLEQADLTQMITPDQANYDAVTSRENQLKQNHMFAVSRIKRSSLRGFLLRIVLWFVEIFAGYKNTPGVLSVIDTIHFARWVRIPKTDQLLFFSNYSGSWESYLEDFITKASIGLTGVWSNTLGFPRTKYLYQFGAKLSEPFKCWARQQQRPTLFWYVANPNVTTAEVRRNALIRQGFSQIDDVLKAEQWFSLFGSSVRPRDSLDKINIQSLVFGGMGKRLPHSKLLFISLNDKNDKALVMNLMKYLVAKINFGDKPADTEAWQIAFTHRGFERLGLISESNSSVFPNVFRQGMDSEARTKILDDAGENHPNNWYWGSGDNKVDFVVMCYFDKEKVIESKLSEFRQLILDADASVVFEKSCFVKRNKNNIPVEHFGFVDGISQPIIKGTLKSYRTNLTDQIINSGEFLCGYPDGRNNISPSPVVESEQDVFNILPEESSQTRPGDFKDFGYNGTYMVIRQLQQNVSAFEAFCDEQSDTLKSNNGVEQASPEWVAAKMIGRWKDGRSLVTHPSASHSGQADNDFRYNKEDPQGLSCPMGAHIRRANPRDSLGTDQETQISLANRHRILRVGRLYQDNDSDEQGIMFMCLNSDIERQFEFVQQSWVNHTDFHGLINEKDPITSPQNSQDSKFTIPTEQGAVSLGGIKSFVTTKGGSYFFMPGRQALNYLLKL